MTSMQMQVLLPAPVAMAPGGEHAVNCEFCLQRFNAQVKNSGKLRNSIEYEPLRKVLMIGNEVEPVLCDTCFRTVMEAAPPDERVLEVPNSTLRMTAA